MSASAPPSAPLAPSASRHSRPAQVPAELQVRAELVALAYRELGPGTLVSFGAALALAVGIGRVLPAIVMWIAGMFIVSGYGLWLGKKFRVARPAADETPLWEWRHLATTTLAALGWGASVWLFPVARMRFSPLLPSTCQVDPKQHSPTGVSIPKTWCRTGTKSY